ncbi:TOG array regulator of axonemal microtubules protein 2 [Latimeria chalumnae]|uniref:TOG array regulator of axonemal microtubules protein 2 n=1 Tax=Latimeria chalumnae TaxID=7897 RepID=UPI00313D0763
MATFNGAKFKMPVAVYCGSVPKVKPGYVSIRKGSVDSNLHLQDSGWTEADKAFLPSTLNLPLKKKPCLWDEGEEQPAPRGWDHKNIYQILDKKRPPRQLHGLGPHPAQREEDIGSAALETSRLKDKMKRRLSEGFPVQAGLPDFNSTVSLPLTPALPRSTSQRLLNAPKPVPPIERTHSPQADGSADKENREQCSLPQEGPATGAEEEHNEVQNSLKHLRYSAEKKRKSLGGSLIPPIPKSERSCHTELIDSPPPKPASGQPDHSTWERKTQRSSTDSRTDQIPEQPTGTGTLQTTAAAVELSRLAGAQGAPDSQRAAGEREQADRKRNPSPSPTEVLAFRLSRELDKAEGSRAPMDGEGEGEWESNGRIHIAISKSAQEKMRQKRREEMEQLRKEKEKDHSQQLRQRLHSVDQCAGSVEEALSLKSDIMITPIIVSSPCGASAGLPLRKRVNRPSLPSIPNIHQISSMRHSSAQSLPGINMDSLDWEGDSENGDSSELRPFSRPEQQLLEALKSINSNEWQLKKKGLWIVRCLASCHSEVLLTRLHDVSLAVATEVNNLRSKVARYAICTLGELFGAMRKAMDQDVEEISRVLLHKTGDGSEFIRDESDRALGVMVESVTPSRALTVLIAGGASHRNSMVRKCTAEHLLTVVELMGAEKVLSGGKESTDLTIQTVAKLAQDGNQDTRFYGRKMLNVLMSHEGFDRFLERSLRSHDLHYILTALKQKGAEDGPSELPAAKGRRRSRTSASQDNTPTNEREDSEPSAEQEKEQCPATRRPSIRSTEAMEQVKELQKLLTAKDFQNRMQGVSLLLERCTNNPPFVSANIVRIFDSFIPRLQDSNKKVNQFALESAATMIPILKDSLHQVLLSMVTVVSDNLNSKNMGIYAAAVAALDVLIASIDNVLLLQPFASRVQFVSGRAMHDITERLAVLVMTVYSRKPQAIERHVLPVFWYLLSNMTGSGVLPGGSGNVRAVVSKLAKSLQQQMGPSLQEYAASQSQHVNKTLQDLISMEL